MYQQKRGQYERAESDDAQHVAQLVAVGGADNYHIGPLMRGSFAYLHQFATVEIAAFE